MLNFTANLKAIEEYYTKYLKDPSSVDSSWKHFFQGIDFSMSSTKILSDPRVFHLILFYRAFGHLYANTNPLEEPSVFDFTTLGFSKNELDLSFPTHGYFKQETAFLKDLIASLEKTYCTRIGFEYLHCEPTLIDWIQKKIEPTLDMQVSEKKKLDLFTQLNQAETLESFLNTKFPGQKRFSLEGGETLNVILHALLEKDIKALMIGMSHRGRINVLTNIAQKPYSLIFHEFQEGYLPFSYEYSSDVKYHKGYSSDRKNPYGEIKVIIPPNPSHLESVNPLVQGYSLSMQKEIQEKEKILPILIHGDASFAGQGIIYELFQFMKLPDYTVGGTLHVVVNNQVGFTTSAKEGKSTFYCTDIAKAFQIPVLHVSAEDPESCLFATNLAFEIRKQFQIDVVIDLVCYRKYGHNEGDEPSFTQPTTYAKIRKKKTICSQYVEQAGISNRETLTRIEQEFKDTLQKDLDQSKEYFDHPPSVEKMQGIVFANQQKERLFERVDTKVDHALLQKVIVQYCQVPDGFHIHKKLEKWLEQRRQKGKESIDQPVIDWSLGELLAFGSLLCQNHSVRLAGQDSRRGTFNQRHDVWIDQISSKPYFPLDHLQKAQGKCTLVNSPLSEYAALGFEYGYSLCKKDALVLWEAQFGDFCNAAQVFIDQYIASSEEKWGLLSSLVLLLPHGYEGQGPEHSSARIERFLQLCANHNMQVVIPSTPSQYFHVLRRQVLQKVIKPLVVFTPKSLLRHPKCQSSMQDCIEKGFEEILEEGQKESKKALICSGKIYYDLMAEKEKRKKEQIVILRIEQLYPFHMEKWKKILEKYRSVQQWFWVQEEPKNMGAYEYIYSILHPLMDIQYIGRKASASPATGSHLQHKQQVQTILEQAFS